MPLTLTPAQIVLLRALIHNQHHDGLTGMEVIDNYVWAASVLEVFPEASRGGILSRAVAAGIVVHQQEWDIVNFKKVDASVMAITKTGWMAFEYSGGFQCE